MRTRPSEITSAFLAEFIALLPSDLEHVDITGGEPTLLKENLPPLIMQVCELEENAEVLMLSNGRSFASAKYTKQFAALAKKRFKIEIPIHSAKRNSMTESPDVREVLNRREEGSTTCLRMTLKSESVWLYPN